MKSCKYIELIIGCAGIFITVMTIGCRTNVPLGFYHPEFTENYGALYGGKRVFLENFENLANDTSTWHYYSRNNKLTYTKQKSTKIYRAGVKGEIVVTDKDVIHNYFWYAFRDALRHIGMYVSDGDNPDLTAPTMGLILISITDENYDVRVTVQKRNNVVFTKEYSITEPPLGEEDSKRGALEQRAYRMTNRLIGTILQDSDFRKVLTEL